MSRYPKASTIPPEHVKKTAIAIVTEFGLTVVARQVHHYILAVSLNHTSTSTANALGISRPNVIRSCNIVEDMRDDPAFDEKLSTIEGRMIRDLQPAGR